MAARRINVLNAAVELAFLLLALAAGYLGAPLYAVALLALAMIAYWFVSRRNTLAQLRGRGPGQFAGALITSLAFISAVLAAAFLIGRALPGSAS